MDERALSEWLRFARDDLDTARILLSMAPRKLEIICYHCAQAAEKYVKAVLLLDEAAIPRIHNLPSLAEQAGRCHPEILALARDFASLQPFSVVVRYPLELTIVPGDEERAFASSHRIAECVEAIAKGQRVSGSDPSSRKGSSA